MLKYDKPDHVQAHVLKVSYLDMLSVAQHNSNWALIELMRLTVKDQCILLPGKNCG